MKRGRKNLNGNGDTSHKVTDEFVKSTYLLDPVLRENLQYLALHERREQSDLVREAIAIYLNSKGLSPHRRPTFTFDRAAAEAAA